VPLRNYSLTLWPLRLGEEKKKKKKMEEEEDRRRR